MTPPPNQGPPQMRAGAGGRPMPAGAAPAVIEPVQLILSAKRNTWRMNDQDHEASDAEFAVRRPKILARDKNTCKGQDCGFTAMKWMEVHHRDDDHANNDPANLVTLCNFCHATFHIGRAGQDGARLVWLPQISQGEFNNILRTLYVGLSGSGFIAEGCRELLGQLELRTQPIVDRLMTDRPEELATALIRLTSNAYEARGEKLAGVRLYCAPSHVLGSRDVWPDMLAFWKSKNGPYGNLPPNTWKVLFERINQVLRRGGG